MPDINLLLVDDHQVVRTGLRMLLEGQPDMKIVGEADSGLQALEKAQHNKVLAAKFLNMSYDSLRYQIKKFGLDA